MDEFSKINTLILCFQPFIGDSSSTVPLQKQYSNSTNGDAPGCPVSGHGPYQPVATRDTRIKQNDPYNRRESKITSLM